MAIRVGTAGWSIARGDAGKFATEGSALERYASVFNAVEVNSSFHRPHQPSTWARWAASVPEEFRFAVKVPKTITHVAKLVGVDDYVTQFAGEVRELGNKLAVLLVQLPPKLALDVAVAQRFFATLRDAIDVEVVCEPRHASWFQDDAEVLLKGLGVARVAADPALFGPAGMPGGWLDVAYWRLHGSPQMYRSSYSSAAIDNYAERLQAAALKGLSSWCMFDNTASSHATSNALSLLKAVHAMVTPLTSKASAHPIVDPTVLVNSQP